MKIYIQRVSLLKMVEIHPTSDAVTLHELCEGIKTIDGKNHHYCVKEIRQLLCRDTSPPINEIVQAGVVPHLVDFLKLRDIPLLFETAWVLTNLVSETDPRSTNIVVENGVIPPLMSLLHIENEEVRNQAMWVLSNISANTGEHRDLILHAGALPAIVTMVRSVAQNPQQLNLLRLGSWTLGNLCKGKPAPPFELICPIFSCFEYILEVADDADTIKNISWTLNELTSTHQCRKALIKTSCLSRLLNKLELSSSIYLDVFRICGNLASGSDAQTTAVLNSSFLRIASETFQQVPEDKLLKEICFTLSNLAVTSVNEIWNYNFIKHLFSYMDKTTLKIDIKRELMHALHKSIKNSNKNQLQVVVSTYSAIPRLCNILVAEENDRVVVSLTLIMIEVILKFEPEYADLIERIGGFDTIESLMEEGGEHSTQATRISSRYFQTVIARRDLWKILTAYRKHDQILPIVLVNLIVEFTYPYYTL